MHTQHIYAIICISQNCLICTKYIFLLSNDKHQFISNNNVSKCQLCLSQHDFEI